MPPRSGLFDNRSYMRKLLISMLCIASLGGCAYRIDVQQGNVIEDDAVRQLRPGMNRRQVRFLMGTPLVHDVFHDDRWDYVYLMIPGKGEPERRHIALFFEGDVLKDIRGDLPPAVEAAPPKARTDTVVVPPRKPKPRGLLTRLWYALGLGNDENLDEPPPAREAPSAPHSH